MEKKKTKETKKQCASQEKERKGKELYFSVKSSIAQAVVCWHCKLKLTQINHIKSNQMQVFEQKRKPENPGKQKKCQRRAENQQK